MIIQFFLTLSKISLVIAIIGGIGYISSPRKKENFLVVIIGWVFAMLICLFCAGALQMRL